MSVRETIQSAAKNLFGIDDFFGANASTTTAKSSFGCHGNPTKPREKAAASGASPNIPSHSPPSGMSFEDLCTGPFIPLDAPLADHYETTDDYEKQRDSMLYQYCTSRYRHGAPFPSGGPQFGVGPQPDPFVLRDGLFKRVLEKYPGLSDIHYIDVDAEAGERKLIGIAAQDMQFKASLSPHVNETIDLPKGSLVKLDHEGRLIEAIVFDELDIPLSAGALSLHANSLIHFEDGGFATSILASDQLYRGNPLKGGTLARWHLDALRADGLKDSIPGDLRDAVLRRDILRDKKTCRHDRTITTAWKTDRMFRRGSLLKCHETKTRAVYHGLPLENAKSDGIITEGFVVGTLWYDTIKLHDMDFVKMDNASGDLISLTPVDETTLQDKVCMAGHEISFHKNGNIKRFTPAENIEIDGVLWWKGKPIELTENGRVLSGTPFNDQKIGIEGIKCAHGMEVTLHENGRIKRAYIAEDQRIDGTTVKGGQFIELDQDGHILARSAYPMLNSKE